MATITGVKDRGVQADEKILREAKMILEKFDANGAVIVSDGEDDESVIPVIQNVLPVVSVPVSYTHLRAHETRSNLVCRLLLEKKKRAA